jgi:hypothetical protein
VYVHASPSEIDARDSQPEAEGSEASDLLDSETVEAPDGLVAGVPQAATQAIERSGLAGMLARIKKRFLGEKPPARDLPAEPVGTTGTRIHNDLADANNQ